MGDGNFWSAGYKGDKSNDRGKKYTNQQNLTKFNIAGLGKN